MNRPEAKALGLERYNTGRPCKHGHLSDRRTNNGICLACERMWSKLNQYAPWQKGVQQRAYAKHKAKIIERTRQHRLKNPDKRKANDAKYREVNREKCKASNEKWRASRPDYYQQFYANNRPRYKEHSRNRKARRKGAEGKHTQADIREILKLQRGRCAYCREKLAEYHVDHIQPLAKGGSNYRRNLQILCEPCNLRKGAKDPVDYARHVGRLI